MSVHARPIAADDAQTRAELARALRRIRPTLILICELGAVRDVAPTLRADLATIVDRVTSYLDAPAGEAVRDRPDLSDFARHGASAELTWHIYADGESECGKMHGIPATWPVGHMWIRKNRAHTIPVANRCPSCWHPSVKTEAAAPAPCARAASGWRSTWQRGPGFGMFTLCPDCGQVHR